MHQDVDKHIPTDSKIKHGDQKCHYFSYNLVFKLVYLLSIHYTTPQMCYNRAAIYIDLTCNPRVVDNMDSLLYLLFSGMAIKCGSRT